MQQGRSRQNAPAYPCIPRVLGRPRAPPGRTGVQEGLGGRPCGPTPLGAGGLTPSGTSPSGRAPPGQDRAWSRRAGQGSRGWCGPQPGTGEDPAPLRPIQAHHVLRGPLGCLAFQRTAPAASGPFLAPRRPQERPGAPRSAQEARRGPREGCKARQGLYGPPRGSQSALRPPVAQRTGRRPRRARAGPTGRASSGKGWDRWEDYNVISCQPHTPHGSSQTTGPAARDAEPKDGAEGGGQMAGNSIVNFPIPRPPDQPDLAPLTRAWSALRRLPASRATAGDEGA